MYAVIETGGKQYRVQPGDIVQVEKLDGEVGTSVNFSQVLLVSSAAGESSQVSLGKPYLSGAQVQAEIVGQGRGEKILITKMKRRKQYRRVQGHRQFQTQLLITAIAGGGQNANLSAEDKTARLSKFHTQLAPKGPARTAPRTESRWQERNGGAGETRQAASSASTDSESAETSAPKAKKAPAAKKKAAPKKK